MTNGEPRNSVVVRAGILFEAALAGLAWLLGWAFGQPVFDRLLWSTPRVVLGAAAALPMLVLFFICFRWPVGPLARIRRFSEQIVRPLFATSTVPELAILALAAGLGEELLFRGFLQSCLTHWLGSWPGLVLASLVFGVFHLITPTYAALATLLGLYLGWLFELTGNLLTPVVAHALYDFVALLYLLRTPNSNPGC